MASIALGIYKSIQKMLKIKMLIRTFSFLLFFLEQDEGLFFLFFFLTFGNFKIR